MLDPELLSVYYHINHYAPLLRQPISQKPYIILYIFLVNTCLHKRTMSSPLIGQVMSVQVTVNLRYKTHPNDTQFISVLRKIYGPIIQCRLKQIRLL